MSFLTIGFGGFFKFFSVLFCRALGVFSTGFAWQEIACILRFLIVRFEVFFRLL